MGSKDDNLDMSTHERVGSLATSKTSANRLKAEGATRTELGPQQQVSLGDAEAIVEGWPEAPKKAAQKLLDQYGPPNEATPTKLFWYRPRGVQHAHDQLGGGDHCGDPHRRGRSSLLR